MKVENRAYPIEKKDFVVIPPQLLHTEVSNPTDPLEYYVLGVSNMMISGFIARNNLYNPVIDLGNINDKIRTLIVDIYNEMQSKKMGYELIVESYYLQFIVLLMRKMKFNLDFKEEKNIRKEIAAARDYIDSHYMEDISLDEIANFVSLSKYHLSREFTKNLGQSPVQYLNDRRIWEAKNLLESTNLTILDISNEVGFSSSSYFTQRFREIEGATPLQYRIKHRKTN